MISVHGCQSLDNEIVSFIKGFKGEFPDLTVDIVNKTMRQEIELRLFHQPEILLGKHECWRCHAEIPVMTLYTNLVNILATSTHEFRQNRLRLKDDFQEKFNADMRQLALSILLSDEASLNVPCYSYITTQYQSGYLEWLFLHIQHDRILFRNFGELKIEKRFSKKADRAYYANICPCCDAQQCDYYLHTAVTSPFHPQNVESCTKILEATGRPVFLTTGLMPIEDILAVHETETVN